MNDFLTSLFTFIPLLIVVLYIYRDISSENPEIRHTSQFKMRRVANWLPLGLAYAFLYMARYNLTVSKVALGDLMTKVDFGVIFGTGAIVYGCSFLLNGPLTDRFGGKQAILIGAFGAAFANILMGIFLYGKLILGWSMNLTLAFIILYSLNMYFQSFGAVAIVKVNAAWFHVRERGVFGGIFGILISLGLFFAYDWGNAIVAATKSVSSPEDKLGFFQNIIRSLTGAANSPIDQTWWVFFIPAIILIAISIVNIFVLRDTPKEAGHENFYTADASAGEDDRRLKLSEIIKRIIFNKVILIIAFIEFCTGFLRQGIMQWYPIYLKDFMNFPSDYFMREHWGLVLMVAGVFGGMIAGWMSDKIFHSRRAPVAGLLYASMFILCIFMIFFVKGDQTILGVIAFAMSFCVIGTHGLLSGTSTMDFGGTKAAGTAVGLIDGFVYLGTGLQAYILGPVTTNDWADWPKVLIPLTVIGFVLSLVIWKAMPTPKAKAAN